MSKVSQELKILLLLNEHYERKKPTTVHEVAQSLEASDRQARRYLESLRNDPYFGVNVLSGRGGGYRLQNRLGKEFLLPENIALALSIASKRNERIEKVLFEIPNYIAYPHIGGDNHIDDLVLDHLETILRAISKQKELALRYGEEELLRVVEPYKVAYTNHTYYLYAVHEERIKKFDIGKIKSIDTLSSFNYRESTLKEIESMLSLYGIKDTGKSATLRVRCHNLEALHNFDRYFEGMGKMDEDNLIYEVKGSSENELYYPLFRISTKSYEFLDEDFKNGYLRYLENQIRSIKGK